mmetsp:Transcript_17872/g.26852  ORF Transcript_17872/g.26852 Transcript_17872/m.26852 type:complete len:125 (-) Transcript_17872:242-616(-)
MKLCGARDGGAKRTGTYSQRVFEPSPARLASPKPADKALVQGLFIIQNIMDDIQEHLIRLTPVLGNPDIGAGTDFLRNQLLGIRLTPVLASNLHGLDGNGRVAQNLLDEGPQLINHLRLTAFNG